MEKQARVLMKALIDIAFMLENKLNDIGEEKYLGASLPESWENIDGKDDPTLDKLERGRFVSQNVNRILIKNRH